MKAPTPLLLIASALLASTRAQAQIPMDHAVQVDRIFEQWSSADSPGCAVGVAKDGLTILSRAYGMADLEHGVPNTPATIFEGGSVSKQFTAAAVVLLALDGKLGVDDDVRKYIPEVPDYGHTITLRHLMNHTSGLRDWGSVADISGWGRERRAHTHADVLDIVSRQTALNFVPGHEYSYSNTGFNLLAILVDRVSGMSFAEFSRRRIFEPLGMTSTQWRDDHRRIVPGRSTAYNALDEGGFEINRAVEDVHGNGGITTTVGDLTTWNHALDNEVFGPGFTRMMLDQGELNDGSEIVYASGLRVETLGSVPAVTHTGSTAGYRAFLARYPEDRLSVALLCNVSNVSTGGTGARIARIYLGSAADDAPAPAGVPVEASALSRLEGLYRDPVTGEPLRVSARGTRLGTERGPVFIPLSPTEFQVGSLRYVFETRGGARPVVHVEGWEYTDQRYEPVESFDPATDLGQYEGTYHSDDAETTLRVQVQDGSLTVWQRPNLTRTLEPIYVDAFDAGPWTLRFRRDGRGRVNELSLSVGRVYDMRFGRVE